LFIWAERKKLQDLRSFLVEIFIIIYSYMLKLTGRLRPPILLLLVITLVLLTFRIRDRTPSSHGLAKKQHQPRINSRKVIDDKNSLITIVYVMLGEPQFQHYILYSIRQARLMNPTCRIALVVSEALYTDRPEWIPELIGAPLLVNLVNYSMLISNYVMDFQEHFVDLWDGLKHGGFMVPTVTDEKGVGNANYQFTQLTTERLFALQSLMNVYKLENVVHLENDQMIYTSVAELVKASQKCDVQLAMSKIGERLAPAVVYVKNSDAILDMLDFMLEAVSNGRDHAIKIAGSRWVTDMTLTAAYFAQKKKGTTTLPNHADDSCIYKAIPGGLIVDGAPLGHWCCGAFGNGQENKFFQIKDEESEVAYWDFPFEWREEKEKGGSGEEKDQRTNPPESRLLLRRPYWNNLPVFNLHIHSKQLQLWGSHVDRAER